MARILIVDDNQSVRNTLRRMLESESYEIHEAIDGEEGLQLYQEISPDLVITDFKMPGMDGAELIGKIRDVGPDAKIILVTGGYLDMLGEGVEADLKVQKPFDVDELLQTVEEFLTLPEGPVE